MPCAYPEEFRRDVVEIPQRNETLISQIAQDFGIRGAVIRCWLGLSRINPVHQTCINESLEFPTMQVLLWNAGI